MAPKSPRKRSFTRSFTKIASAAAAIAIALVGSATVAQAAPPYVTNATISNLKFVDAELTQGTWHQMTADWSLPDHPTPNAGFTIPLPAGLEGRVESFPMLVPGTSTVMGQCVSSATSIECELDSAYIAANPLGLHGSVDYWTVVRTEVTTTTDTTYDFGTTTITIPVNPIAMCQQCEFSYPNQKWGTYDYASNIIVWRVLIESDRLGARGGDVITVTEHPGPGQEMVINSSTPALRGTNVLGNNPDGQEAPQNMHELPSSAFTVNQAADGTVSVTFTTVAGWYYDIFFQTRPTSPGVGSTEYTNSVDYEINGVHTDTQVGDVTYSGGSATGVGANVGVFTLEKQVDGEAVNLPADQVFTGTYSVVPPGGGAATTGTWSVIAGEQWRSPEFPKDSVVTLTEDTPSDPANIVWSSPVFSSNGFPLAGGQLTPVTLTNTAGVKLSYFEASKLLTGDQGALDLVPTDATFTLDYSYPAGVGFAAGNGSLVLPMDGTVVRSPAIPIGAVVTVEEQTPAEIDGVAWLAPVFSDNGFSIVPGTIISVDLTNPAQLRTGAFAVQKKITGSGADLVNAKAEFLVDYAYPAGAGFEAGSGQLKVLGDGAIVTSPQLPYGAVVTLTEVTPTAVKDGKWVGASFDHNTITIGAGTVANVILTNDITTVPKSLANTGGDPLGTSLVMGAGVLMLVAGALASLRRPRVKTRR